jgi:hypothetical protein
MKTFSSRGMSHCRKVPPKAGLQATFPVTLFRPRHKISECSRSKAARGGGNLHLQMEDEIAKPQRVIGHRWRE